MSRTATPHEFEFSLDVGPCLADVDVCVHPPGLPGNTWAISARDDEDVITPQPEESFAPKEHACSCLSVLPHGLESILGPSADDSVTSEANDEPAISEARPTRRGEAVGPMVELDANELVLRLEGNTVGLTRTQFSILSYLVQHTGRWITTAELIREVLGTHHQPDTSLVRVHVHAIRRRLGTHSPWLESDRRRARGYRWRPFELEKAVAAAESAPLAAEAPRPGEPS